jgi:hypothetical protein
LEAKLAWCVFYIGAMVKAKSMGTSDEDVLDGGMTL